MHNYEDSPEYIGLIQREFLNESENLLEQLEGSIEAIEGESPNAEDIDNIFRVAHTFKGSAMAANFEGLANFSHAFEDLLSQLVSGSIQFKTSTKDLLFEINDKLHEYVAALRENPAGSLDVEQLREKIATHQKSSGNKSQDSTPKPSNGLTILIVEDDKDILEIIESVVLKMGLNCDSTNNGFEAIMKFASGY